MSEQRPILTLAQACEHLQVSDKTLRAIIVEGKLRASKVGATWRIRTEDIDTYLEESRFVPSGGASPGAPSLGKREASWTASSERAAIGSAAATGPTAESALACERLWRITRKREPRSGKAASG